MQEFKVGKRGQCSRCEVLPDISDGGGELHLWLPLEHTLGKTYKHLRAGGWDCGAAEDHCLIVRLDGDRTDALLADLSEILTSRELEDTKALHKPGGDEPSAEDIPRVKSLKRLVEIGRSGWLLDMISEGRLTSHFQPIVMAEDPSEVFGQEALLRGIDEEGGLISPGRIFGAAKKCGVLFQMDLAARRTAIREAAWHKLEDKLFINFTPTSIYDPKFCLRSTVEAVDEAGFDHESVVFEVTETEYAEDFGHLKDIIDHYRETGFGVALDDVGSGYSSLNLLSGLRPDYVKLDLQLVRGVDGDPYKATVARKLLEMARDLDVKTVVEGIETEEEFMWAREEGATFVQGYLIARPGTPPLQNRLSSTYAGQ